MTWLAWRSQRLQLLACAGVVALLAAWLAITGAADHSAIVAAARLCPNGGGSPRCEAAYDNLMNANRWTTPNYVILLVLPGVLGLVLGVPLVAREIEHGTNRLVWTQSIGRTRWLAIKLLLGGLVTAAVVGALDLLLPWWNNAVQNPPNILPRSFSVSGFVDVGYALFAFMLGAALGSVIRHTGWAIAAGVPLFAAFRFWVMALRPHLAPIRIVSSGGPFGSIGLPAGQTVLAYSSYQANWLLNSGYVPDGRDSPSRGQNWNTGLNLVFSRCDSGGGSLLLSTRLNRCADRLKLHWVTQYQPASHFWALQTAETAIFVAAAIVLCGITVLSVRRWRT